MQEIKINKQTSYQPSSQELNRASTEGQVLATSRNGLTISISVVQQTNDNLTAFAYLNGRRHTFTIDAGATQSVIRPDVVKVKCEVLHNVILRTAMNECAIVHEKTETKVTIASISLSHVFIIADPCYQLECGDTS